MYTVRTSGEEEMLPSGPKFLLPKTSEGSAGKVPPGELAGEGGDPYFDGRGASGDKVKGGVGFSSKNRG